MTELMTAAEYRAMVAKSATPKGKANPRNKFGARSVRIDGHFFPSLLEGRRYGQLKLLQRSLLIRGLVLQRRFDLSSAGEKVCEYRADFFYDERAKDGAWLPVAEDAKGFETPLYKLKKALFIRLYPHITFREVKR